MIKLSFAILGCAVVTACGGAGAVTTSPTPPATLPPTQSTPVPPPRTDDYVPLATVTNLTSGIGGIADVTQFVRSAAGATTFDPVAHGLGKVTGTYDHKTGIATTTDSTIRLTNSRLAQALMGADMSVYQYAGISAQTLAVLPDETAASDNRITSTAIFGVPTAQTDMPIVGITRYVGDAILAYEAASGTVSAPAAATVTVNFLTTRVNVTIAATQPPTTRLPIDTMQRLNMQITGNGFSGGYARFSLDGTQINPTGQGASSFARGLFFGPSTDFPAELGGMISVTGSDVTVSAQFVAGQEN